MVINKLELQNFRNYESLCIDFSPNINILYGDNAQGKTNILEALYVGCTTKSHRAGSEREMIRFGCDESHMRMFVLKKDLNRKIDMHLKRNKPKGVAVDGIPVSRAAELYGMFNIVSFSPDDLSIIKNGPAERRRFTDMELCQLDRSYMHSLTAYNRALMQRNMLLKQISGNKDLEDTLSVWDEQLIRYGSSIIEARKNFINDLGVIAAQIHESITGGEERLTLKYQPSTSAGSIAEDIALSRERDIFMKVSNVGPHRDDIGFIINDTDARKYGSQGQQRTVALTLKLAEIELVKKKTHDNPVLLLDDVLSELDRNRQNQLLGSITGIQTFITCTGLEEFVNNRVKYDCIYHVEQGSVRRDS